MPACSILSVLTEWGATLVTKLKGGRADGVCLAVCDGASLLVLVVVCLAAVSPGSRAR